MRDDPDPFGLIDAFLGCRAAGQPEQAYLAWLLSLTPRLDPARAAGMLLARPDLRQAAATAAGGHLLRLLEDTARWPQPAVAAFAADRHPHRKPA